MADRDRIEAAVHTADTLLKDPWECYEDDESACAAADEVADDGGCDGCCCC